MENDYILINNDFYENEYICVFNYLVYNLDSLSYKLGIGEFYSLDLDVFSILFGYGIEIKINKWNKVGYEYFLNFFYDCG